MRGRSLCVTLLLLCSFVCPLYAATNDGKGAGPVKQGSGQAALVHDADVVSRALVRDLVPASTAVSASARSAAGRLVLESLVFLAVLATSLTLFPGWYSVLVALSALFSLYETATTAAAVTPVFTARGDFSPMNVTDTNCQVQLLCEVTRLTRARFPVVATLLKSAARGDHRGGPFVQAILAGLSRVDCATLFGCPRDRIEPLLARQPRR
ncbi:uncharacterized protein [Dermacentor albipictus]|uniref:uncharacterized protein isoform X1 n=1 Tax=Dermacentor albipictus TaxID=60249 RepID=UPI0031FD96A2